MGLPPNLRSLLPLTGQKLKSVAVLVGNEAVDQPLVKETRIPSPLKPLTPAGVIF